MRQLAGWALVALCSSSLAAADSGSQDQLKTPDPEITPSPPAVSLPALPTFAVPPPEPGFTTPKHLRVAGKAQLGTEVNVKGYIIWIYNCLDAVRSRNESVKAAQQRIDADPTLCERPKFYLGETRTLPQARGLWVVDVPRPPNKLEKERLPKEELAAWPKPPKLKVGDYVVVTGQFALESPHHEANSDGLVVFKSIAPAKPPKTAPAATANALPEEQQPAIAIPKPPPGKTVGEKDLNWSLLATQAGHAANGRKSFAEAIEAFGRALKHWDQNHSALWGMGVAYAATADWKRARDFFVRAATIRPDVAMHQMWAGIAEYERAVQEQRAEKAIRLGVKPEEVQVDQDKLKLDEARKYLELALAIEPRMWRGQYYLGRVYRATNNARLAARAFGLALAARPSEQGPVIALTELYRKWDYTEEAIVVAKLGVEHVPDTEIASDVHFVLGMAYDDKGDRKQAVAAFTKALELKATNYKALFQRGQAYVKLRKKKEAKADLEAFLASAGASLDFAKQQANRYLLDLR